MAIARLNRQAKRPYGLWAKTTAVTILGLCFIFVWSFFSSSSSTSVTARRESFDDIAEPISGNSRISNFGTQITHENEKSKKKSGSDLEKDDKRVNGSVSVSKSINEHKSEKKNTRVVANKKKLPEKKPKEGNDNKPVESEGEEDSEKEKEGLVVDGKEEALDGEGEEAEGENVLAEAVDQEESEEKKLESDGSESNRGKKRKKIKGPVFDPKMKYNWKLCSTKSKHNYIPCIDYDTSSLRLQSYRHTERTCPKTPVMCLVPLPHDGYEIPIRWPESKVKILYKNVAHPKLAAFVKKHSWIMKSGEYLTFPQNQSEFKGGVLHYLESIEETVPDIEWGKNIRVVLDIGCTDSSFGASLLDKEVLTLSLGLKDDLVDLAQVALERGFPTIVSPFGGRRLPFPSAVFDAIHCGECSIKWHSNGGKHLLEMNRILRPGGYFILSTKHDNIEDEEAMTTLTASICWNILAHKTDDFSEVGVKIYQKPESNDIYGLRRRKNPPLCKENENPDAAWYVPMKTCLHPIPSAIEQHGTEWPEEWPKRLDTVPDWLDDKDKLVADSKHWSSIIEKSYLTGLGIDWANIRNVMDMKAIYGGCNQPVWIVVEMDRMLRPGGWTIIRDKVEILGPLEGILKSLNWDIRLTYAQDKEGIICAQKNMWRP
ncbi:putative methyltransferase PMT28 [Morus notabilis]|uniref:Methyltransferase n=1 Tax=Morus notabilis TaxID=981085 RepID=W9R1H8_9ROSA|nr:putative methyltransferase PMT28 [Morus notabilis]